MGKRGPQPTPTKILQLRGSWRAKKRPANVSQTPLKSHAPAWLDAEAKKIWKAKNRHSAYPY
jgi:phage terminase small subunit